MSAIGRGQPDVGAGLRVSLNLIVLGLLTTISPLFLIAAVLMMSESEKVRNAWAAALGWALSIGVCCAAMLLVGGALHGSKTSHRSHRLFGLIDLALGLVVTFLAVREFRRSRSDTPRELPKWANRVGTMSVIPAFVLGAFLPANVLSYAAGNEIVQQHVSTGQEWLAVAIYVLIGSSLEVLPILYLTLRPAQRAHALSVWHRWLDSHWQQVLVVLFTLVAAFMLIKGTVAVAVSM